MADSYSEQTPVDPVSAAEAQPDEASQLDSIVPWGNGSAPSLPLVDNDDNYVSVTAQNPQSFQ